MIALSIVIGVHIWVLGQARSFLECLWVPSCLALRIVAKLLCSSLCLFDAIVELYAINEKLFNEFLSKK